MGDVLNLFPQRAAIGRADASGVVYMTPEFSRALAVLLARVGGPMSVGVSDLVEAVEDQGLELATLASVRGHVLAQAVADLELQLAQAAQLSAHLVELRRQVADLELQLVNVAPPTDWEHPGKIGAARANSGTFTTVNKVTITAPAGSATLTLTDGKTFKVSNSLTFAGVDGKTLTLSNTLTLAGNDGATLNIGAGGTLGSAAYTNSGVYAARTGVTLAAAATDPATTQALVNQLRNVLISVGIGS